MTIYELSRFLTNPKVKEAILAGYQGYNCLAVTRSPANRDQLMIRVSVESKDVVFPTSIKINDVEFPIEVEDGYVVPLDDAGVFGPLGRKVKKD